MSFEKINTTNIQANETNVNWIANGEKANEAVLNRPAKDVAEIINTNIDLFEGEVKAILDQFGIGASVTSYNDWNQIPRDVNGFVGLNNGAANKPSGFTYNGFLHLIAWGNSNDSYIAKAVNDDKMFFLSRDGSGNFIYHGEFFHTGNDGANSGLDADLLDGVQGDKYARRDQPNTFTGFLTLNADPTNDLHAATKKYVDTVAQGLDFKESVRVATIGNITLSGHQNIDGLTTTNGMRVLVKDQTDKRQNGIYVARSTAWTRSEDADGNPQGEVTTGMFTFVEGGVNNQSRGFVLSTIGNIVLGTTNLTFTQFSGAGQIEAGTGIVKNGDTLSFDQSFGDGRYVQQGGKAADSDKLDGLNSTQFLRSDQNDTMSGSLHVTNGITSNGAILSGLGSGGVAMTVNDGAGNANLTFNHNTARPEQNGNAGRITVNTDDANNATMSFGLKSSVVGDGSIQAVSNLISLTENWLELFTAQGLRLQNNDIIRLGDGSVDIVGNGANATFNANASITIHADKNNSSSVERLILKAGVNELRIEGGATSSATALRYNGVQVLTTASGKAVDSDKLDGLNSTQFLRSDEDDTMTGDLTLRPINYAANQVGGLFIKATSDTGWGGQRHGIFLKSDGSGTPRTTIDASDKEVISVTAADNGRVGIGTPTVDYKLDVRNDLNTISSDIARFEHRNSSNGDRHWLVINADSSANNVNFRSFGTNNGGFTFNNSLQEFMRITPAGGVGIGTTTPSRHLEVSTSDNVPILARSTDSLSVIGIADNAGSVGVAAAGGNMLFYVDGITAGGNFTEKMRLSSIGNLGIGTTNPRERLDVNGAMTINNQIIRTGTGRVLNIPDQEGASADAKKQIISLNGQGGLYQVSDNGGLLITPRDDCLILANGDVGRNFTSTDINTVDESVYILSDSAFIVKTDLQEGWGTEHTLTFSNAGGLFVNGNTVYHQGNDGSGSGLDADLLDGLDSSAFLKLNTNGGGFISTDNYIEAGRGSGGVSLTVDDGHGNANVAFNHRAGVPDNNGSSARIESEVDSVNGSLIFEVGNNVTAGTAVGLTPVMTLTTSGAVSHISHSVNGRMTLNSSDYGEHLRLTRLTETWSITPSTDGSLDFSRIAGTSTSFVDLPRTRINGSEVWHSGNDGSGSGLDADLLDGQHRSESATANTVASRDGSADIHVRLVRSNYATQNTMPAGSDICFRVNDSNNNYMRFVTRTGFADFLEGENRFATKSTTKSNSLGDAAWIAAYVDGGNVDHIWHDEGSNTWNFVSDSGFKTPGNSDIKVNRVNCGDIVIASATPQIFFQKTGFNDYAGIRFAEEAESGGTNNNGGLEFWTSDDFNEPFVWNAYDTGSGGTGAHREWMRLDNTGLSVYGNVTAFDTSDERLKDNMEIIPNALDKVMTLNGYSFNWNDKQKHHEAGMFDYGLSAQEVKEVLPAAVKEREGYLTVNYQKVIPLLVASNKELKSENDELKSKVESLEEMLLKLAQEVQELKNSK